jgi:Prohead core protein serine protease
MKLIKELSEEVEFLIENTAQGKKFFIEGPFLSYDTPNKNGRVYSESIMRPAVGKYIKEYVDTKRAMGELGHPPTPSINLDKVSHIIEGLSFKESTRHVVGKARILETPMGKIAQNLMEGGVKLGVSSRGLGSVKMVDGLNHVQSDFTINTVDIVGDPSGSGCFVEGIMESSDWKLVNGQWIEAMSDVMVEVAKKRVDEAVALEKFKQLIESLKG